MVKNARTYGVIYQATLERGYFSGEVHEYGRNREKSVKNDSDDKLIIQQQTRRCDGERDSAIRAFQLPAVRMVRADNAHEAHPQPTIEALCSTELIFRLLCALIRQHTPMRPFSCYQSRRQHNKEPAARWRTGILMRLGAWPAHLPIGGNIGESRNDGLVIK
ncbi:hypothetical protein KIN20_001835 [Parelaphostrongylus tenuis]|uniref:Uncharacterized protein n=1 Tax=Parelaphostrongylus tenuis TaxID=148309 RepID=A0AAD5MFN9_PARTN|nr:hypothetical protein KIN20_001835 [Parelaphostrongylus tenuis]